jgi:hypothetical protein
LPEPIDLELDLKNRLLYWTDRGELRAATPSTGASMDSVSNKDPAPEILFTHLEEGIGIALRFQRKPDVRHRFSRLDLFPPNLTARKRNRLWLRKGNLTGSLTRKSTQRKIDMSYNNQLNAIAVVGTGVIGASWAAEYLARGFDVVATDPAPNAEANLRKYVDEAWKDLTNIGLSKGASRDRLTFTKDSKEALSKATSFRRTDRSVRISR